jgi:hypothetical protein
MMYGLNGENKYAIFREIISSVIHDLKNPLSAITLGLEFIEMNSTGKIPPQAISGAISSAARIDQLLDALSMYFHDDDTPPTAVPFAHLLNKARLLVGYYFSRNQVKFTIEEGGSDQSVLVNLNQAYQGMVLLLVGLAKRCIHGTDIRATISGNGEGQAVAFALTLPDAAVTAGGSAPAQADIDFSAVCFDTARGLFQATGIELSLPAAWQPPAQVTLRKAIDAAQPPRTEGR